MDKHWSLIGLADETGISNVGGRTGAAAGPALFRMYFNRLKGNPEVAGFMTDLGDVRPQPQLEETHRQVTAQLEAALADSFFTIVVGGGHDLAFPHLRAYNNSMETGKKLGCINIDVHLDLRPDKPVITSGSPFYMALTHKLLEGQHFVEFGIQEYANAPELFAFAETNQVNIVRFDEFRNGKAIAAFKKSLEYLAEQTDQIVISLDLDALQAAYAPGVSAPAAEGFTPSEMVEMVRLAASHEKVTSLGIYELNPEFDIDGRTARLAAVLAYQFATVKLANRILL